MSSKRDNFPVRIAILVGIPLAMIAAAGAIDDSAISSALFFAGVVALAVMLVESLLELRQYHLDPERGIAKLSELEAQIAKQATEIEAAGDARRLASLLRFIGETGPTVAELSLKDPYILDSWFDLIANRVQKETATGYAQVVLLQDSLKWEKGEFVSRYEVVFSGGSEEFGLVKKSRLPASDSPAVVLRDQTGAGSVYLSEFSFGDEPYWLCLLLSTSAPHEYLESLARVIVTVVLVTLGSLPPTRHRPVFGESETGPEDEVHRST